MSGTGPESIPVSADPRSRRPIKKRALSPTSAQKAQLETLLKKPDQEIRIPPSATDPNGNKRRLPLPPEIVTNVQGSSAGAGSGEFHVYKAARRREYERLRRMDDEVRQVEADREFRDQKEKRQEEDEAKTRRNREKREKMRLRKEKAKLDKKNGGGGGGGAKTAAAAANTTRATGVKARVAQNEDGDENSNDAGNMDVDSHNKAATTETTKTDTPGLIIHDDDD